MKTKFKLSIACLLLLISLNTQAQSLDTTRYWVTEGFVNSTDYSDQYYMKGQFLQFYTNKNGVLNFLNSSRDLKTYSFGKVSNLKRIKIQEDDGKGDAVYFRWRYFNSYDRESGYAFVELKRFYRPGGVQFSARIVSKKLDSIEFSGYTNERKTGKPGSSHKRVYL